MPEAQIELSYDSADAIPAGFAGLYDEVDGKFTLAGVSGMKTQQDVNNVQEALRKERADHNAAKTSLKAWGDLKPDEVMTQLDRIKELEAAGAGKIDETKMTELVEARLTQKTAPMERQITTLTTDNEALKAENANLKSSIERRDMNDEVRAIATEMKVLPTAIADVELVAAMFMEKGEDGKFIVKADAQGVTPGVDMQQFLKEMQKIRPHWWPASQGGGAGGGAGEFGGSANPFSHEGWNMTQQAKIVQEKGMAFAQKLAEAAGTKVGGLKPPAKK